MSFLKRAVQYDKDTFGSDFYGSKAAAAKMLEDFNPDLFAFRSKATRSIKLTFELLEIHDHLPQELSCHCRGDCWNQRDAAFEHILDQWEKVSGHRVGLYEFDIPLPIVVLKRARAKDRTPIARGVCPECETVHFIEANP